MTLQDPSGSRLRHSFSPPHSHYYPVPPPHPSQQHPMWQPHLHHHPSSRAHRGVHTSHPPPPSHPHHHFHAPPPHAHGRPDGLPRQMSASQLHHHHPELRYDYHPSHQERNDRFEHRHRRSYPPNRSSVVAAQYGAASWKRQKVDEANFVVVSNQVLEDPGMTTMNQAAVAEVPASQSVEKPKPTEGAQICVQSIDKPPAPARPVVTVECVKDKRTEDNNASFTRSKQDCFQNTLKSPVTMCFERFLGAAEVLAEKSARRKQDVNASKENTKPNLLCPSSNQKPLSNASTPAQHRPVRLVDKFPGDQNSMSDEAMVDRQDAPNPFDELSRNRELQRRVILHMALQRNVGDEAGDVAEDPLPSLEESQPKTTIEDGFYWKEFPVCEAVLYKHMADYYGISSVQRQSKMQHTFNKMLVVEVRKAADEAGISFDPSFTEKKLRDRIRCFYKTHLQNAKKRLVTLQKRPESISNQAIVRVYIRCVKTGISFKESLYMEPNTEDPTNKRGRLSHVDKAKLSLKRDEDQLAAQNERLSSNSTQVDHTNTV